MKRNQVIIIAVSLLTLATMGVTTGAKAQASGETELAYCPGSTPEAMYGPRDSDWRREFENITLSSEQVNQVCELKARVDQEAFGADFNLQTLLDWANAGQRGEQAFNQSSIASAIRRYNAGIQRVLTPEQYQQWQRNGSGS